MGGSGPLRVTTQHLPWDAGAPFLTAQAVGVSTLPGWVSVSSSAVGGVRWAGRGP